MAFDIAKLCALRIAARSSVLGLLALGGSALTGCAEGDSLGGDEAGAPSEHSAPPAAHARFANWSNELATATPRGPIAYYPPGAVATLSSETTDDEHSRVLIYAPRSGTNTLPIAALDLATRLGSISRLAFDRHRELYILEYSGRVSVFASGAQGNDAPLRVINPSGLYTDSDSSYAEGIAIDRRDEVAISLNTNFNEQGPKSVITFAADASGDVEPIRNLEGAKTGFDFPTFLAFDAHDRLYVGDYGASRVSVFRRDADANVAPQRIACQTVGFTSMTLAEDGSLYVAPEGVPGWSIRVYDPFDGVSQKLRGVIGGPSTGLDDFSGAPIGMGVDVWGNLSMMGPSLAQRFAPGALGDVAPVATLHGTNAIAVAPRGEGQ